LERLEMKFFLINCLVTLIAYGLTSFVYPAEGTFIPRICLMWGAPILGTMVAWWLTRVALLARAFAAQALAIYTVSGIYCLLYRQKAIFDTLQYVTITYFLPGAILALLWAIFARWVFARGTKAARSPFFR
jgi:hypothetical protein